MGSLFSGKNTTTATSTPWGPQGSALSDVFSKAKTAFEGSEGTPFYQGDLYAGMDPQTATAIQNMLAYAQSKGQAGADSVSNTGAALTNPGAFTGAIDKFAGMAGTDPTQANIAAATAYANNPAMDGMVDAASRDVRRSLYEQEIPGINRAATGTGNINSSRSGVAQGIAERGAADRVGDISATLRGDAYNRGLGLAEQARGTNLNAAATGAGLYGQQLGMGLDATRNGNNMALGNFGAQVDASSLFQKDQQGQLDADFASWQGQDSRTMDLLNRYYGVVGANNWGGTQTQTQKSSPSIFGSILGLGSLGAGFGLFGGGSK